MTIYSEPEKYGLTTLGEIDWSDGCYQFNLTVVWQRTFDGEFVYGEDSGCSCPASFEDQGVEDLTVLRKRGGLNDFKAHCEQRQADNIHGEDRSTEIVALIERLHAAGAR